MRYLQKTWVRIIVSLLAGGFVSELIHVSTGNPNRQQTNGESYLVLIVAAITYFILSWLVNKQKN